MAISQTSLAARSAGQAGHVTDHGTLHTSVNDLTGVFNGWAVASTEIARVFGWKIASDYGLDTTGATVHTAAAVQAWLDAGVPYASGTIQCSGAVTIKGDADLHLLDWNYTGTTGVAITVATGTGASLSRKTVWLPELVATAKTTTTWSQVAGTVGVQMVNCTSCNIIGSRIASFETGLSAYGQGAGCAYNTVRIAHLDNNKINHDVSADATGWANENHFYLDRISHDSVEGASVSGVRGVRVQTATSIPNNNLWIGGSFEGDVDEYHLECAGLDNRFLQCRWENGGAGCRVYWRNGNARNVIDRGYGSHQIVETYEGSALAATIISGQGWKVRQTTTKGIIQLENYGSATSPQITGMAPGAVQAGSDPATAYCWYGSANLWGFKRSTESFDRIQIDAQNSRIYFGSGAATIVRYLSNLGTTSIAVNGGNLVAGTDNALDLGIASFRFRDLNLGRNAVVGGTLAITGNVGFYGTAVAAKPTVTGSRGGNAALASLLTGLAGLGLLTDSSTA